jgi:thiamine biosynthesis lipoprotein
MYKRTILKHHFVFLLPLLLYCEILVGQERKFSFTAVKMGSPFNLVIVRDDSAKAARLAKAAYLLVDSLNALFSDYDPASELSRINSALSVNTKASFSPALSEIFRESFLAYKKSSGAFDISVGALSMLWRRARKEKRFPTAVEVTGAREKSGMRFVHFDFAHRVITTHKKGIRFDLGGIAKGYAAQQVIGFLKTQGVNSALADAGGDIATSGAPPAGGWNIGVNVPETTSQLLQKKLWLHDMAVATSGDAYQYMESGGKKYSHIIDPRTGYGISTQRNVTVIAKDATTADWLATACSILPIPAAKKLALANHAELLITELREEKVVFHITERFSRFWKR